MDVLHAAALLERIALIAKLSSKVECRPSEREIAAIWIAEMAGEAMEKLDSADDGLIAKTEVFH